MTFVGGGGEKEGREVEVVREEGEREDNSGGE